MFDSCLEIVDRVKLLYRVAEKKKLYLCDFNKTHNKYDTYQIYFGL